jgi:hypothetical protein
LLTLDGRQSFGAHCGKPLNDAYRRQASAKRAKIGKLQPFGSNRTHGKQSNRREEQSGCCDPPPYAVPEIR